MLQLFVIINAIFDKYDILQYLVYNPTLKDKGI